jgi:hypothetical protein
MSENAFEPMMGEDLMFPGRYLKSVELKGRDVPITIDRVDKEELLKRDKKTKETKWILHFRESEKALVLNVTNARTITGLYGNAKGWAGKRITLYPTTCHGERGKIVACIRVRDKAPGGRAAPAPEPEPLPPYDGPIGEDGT